MPDTTTLPEGDVVTTPVVPSTHTFLPSLTKFASVNDKSPKLPIRVSCFEILKLADEDPWKWFTTFADPKFTFLGREFTGGVHDELAKHLREIEKKMIELADKINNTAEGEKAEGSEEQGNSEPSTGDIAEDEGEDPSEDDRAEPDPPESTEKTTPATAKIEAFTAGTKLGLAGAPDYKAGIKIRGARKEPRSAKLSMHFFGLALDLDYDFNFFPETSGRTAINNVLKDARLLFEPDVEPQKEPEVPWGWPKKGNTFKNLEYEQVRQINEKLINFFGLIDDKVKLEELRSAAKAEPWTNFADVEIAGKHIEQLLSDMFSVIRDKKDGTLKIGKKTGIMTISKELHDGMGLSWGGAYGDTMHFDARNLAKGKQIQNAIQSFKKDTTKHKELAEVWKSFIGKNEAEMLTEFAKHYPKP